MELSFCPIFSGSSGNALYLGSDQTRLLIDAGVSGRRVCAELGGIGVDPTTLSGILVTHEHSDHTAGVGVLSRRFDLPVYAAERTWAEMQPKIGPIAPRNMRIFEPGQDFYIGEIGIAPFSTPHDAVDPVGFAFHIGRVKLSVATDLGYVCPDWMRAVSGSDILLIESNHDVGMLEVGPYPYALKRRILGKSGHLSNDDAGKAIAALSTMGVRNFILGHLSGENNYPKLAYQCAADALKDAGVTPGLDVGLSVAYRTRRSGLFTVDDKIERGPVMAWR